MKNTGYKNTYTRSSYSRGAMRTREKIWEGLKGRSCEICGKPLERKYTLHGIENIYRFLTRKTCGRIFDDKLGKYVNGECMKKYREIPENNPRYKGLMHRRCKICGKQGLSYVCTDEKLPELCIKCYQENRPTAYNFKGEFKRNCKYCEKEFSLRQNPRKSNRNKKGSIDWDKVFCSKKCANRFNFSLAPHKVKGEQIIKIKE